MMIEKVSTMDIHERLGDILNRVSLRHDEFIIERKGRALAAMVPVEKLIQLERLARLRLLDALRSARTGLSEKEADTLANEARHRSRKGRAK